MPDAGKAGTAALLAELQGDDAPTRWRAAARLARVHTPEAARALGCALYDAEPFVRWSAAQALSEIANRASDQAVPLLVVQIVLEAAAAPEPAVRATAADVIANWGRRGPLGPLPALAQDADASVRAAAVRALGLAGVGAPQVAGPVLQRALSDCDAEVRRMAAAAVAWCHYDAALPELQACLADPVGPVRAAALRALAQIGSSVQEAAVLPLLHDPDVGVRAEAVRFMRAQGREKALSALATLEADGSRVREGTLGELAADARLHIARRLGPWQQLRLRWGKRRGQHGAMVQR